MKIQQDVLEILDQSRLDGLTLFLPPGQLERKLYMAVNKVLELAGGKWNKSAKGHVFAGPVSDAIEPIILTGEITDNKQEFGAFFTPAPLARDLIEMADIRDGHDILEPSAGVGNLLREMPGDTRRRAVEINPDFAAKLHPFAGVTCADFLTCNGELGVFDRVVMNPPFAKGADITHVIHAMKFLRPSGLLVSIMSKAVTFRSDKRYADFRSMVTALRGEITPLPDGSFKSSGTGVNTVVLRVRSAP